MDPDTETPSPIRSLYYIKSSGRVVVALHSGRIFMCQSDTIPVKETGGEGTFILTELGTSGCVHSVTSINKVKIIYQDKLCYFISWYFIYDGVTVGIGKVM